MDRLAPHSRRTQLIPTPISHVNEFETDLSLIRESLAANRGVRLAELIIDPLLRKVRTFGFHLSTLDIRQHARVHAQALAEIEANVGASVTLVQQRHGSGGHGSGPHERDARAHIAPTDGISGATQDVLETFREIATLKKTYPCSAIRNYIISGAQSEDDVLAVTRLAAIATCKVAASGDDPGLMPVPLFESIEALRSSADVMGAHLAVAGLSTTARLLGTLAGSHAGLFRFQQGWRHADQHLGVVQSSSRSASRRPGDAM